MLTLWRGEEVKEGVVGDRLGDRPHGAAALVLLFLLDRFQCDVLALRPGNRATVVKQEEEEEEATRSVIKLNDTKGSVR